VKQGASTSTKFSEFVSDAAIAQGKTPGNEVQVLHVLEPLPALEAGVLNWKAITNEQKNYGQTLINSVAEKLRSAGVQFTTVIKEGGPKSVILDTAEKCSADLILVGSHGHDWVERFLLGSVSEAVARHAPCSVQIVRAPKLHA
jgi:nucleotide-binding universal stress UspA family protein